MSESARARHPSRPEVVGKAIVRPRSLTGDVSWDELVSDVRGAVVRIAGPGREVDDLTQAALEQVVRSLDSFEGRAELRTFVYRIAARVVMNHWRSFGRWLRRFELGTPAREPAADEDEAPSSRLEACRRIAHLHRLLDRLDAKKRIVLVLVDLEELPTARVAEILECPEPTVRSRLRLARNALAVLVRSDPFFREELDDDR